MLIDMIISYPNSKWDNIRNNMGGGGGGGGTNPPPTGSCSGTAAWESSKVYTGGMTATYSECLRFHGLNQAEIVRV